MTERSVRHAKFTIERLYPATRERVFKAFADPQSKASGSLVPTIGTNRITRSTSVSAARKP